MNSYEAIIPIPRTAESKAMKLTITNLLKPSQVGFFLPIIFLISPNGQAHEFESSVKKTHLLELFSTQSCSSCPPAQKWISSLKTEANLWKTFIPVVFHVDYWNYLGWKDPYSAPSYTNRQRYYTLEWKKNGVYTPMFVLNGKENRNRSKDVLNTYGPKVGVLKATEIKKGVYKILFSPIEKYHYLEAHYAILGNNISTNVRAGENNGKELTHDFLTLKAGSTRLKNKQNTFLGELKIPYKDFKKPSKQSIIFWVSLSKHHQSPIQSVGGPLEDK